MRTNNHFKRARVAGMVLSSSDIDRNRLMVLYRASMETTKKAWLTAYNVLRCDVGM